MTSPSARDEPARRRITPAVLIAVLLGLAVTFALFLAVSALEYRDAEAEFKRRANHRINALRAGFSSALDDVAAVDRLFAVNPGLTREQFSYFTAPLLQRGPHIRAIGFQRFVPHGARAGFEAQRRAEGAFSGVTELRDGKLVPAGVRPTYRVIDYLVPDHGLLVEPGVDSSMVGGESEARRACATGQPTMSGIFQLPVEGADRKGVVLMRAAWRDRGVQLAEARCGDALLGYSVVVLSLERFVRGALEARGLELEGFNISLYEGPAAREERLAFRIGKAPRARDSRPLPLRWALSRTPPDMAETIQVAGRSWLVVVSPEPHRIGDFVGALVVLAGGLAITLLAALQASLLAGRTRRVRRLVDERSAALSGAKRRLTLLEQAIEASVNGVVIINARAPDYTIEYVNPAFERLTGYPAAEVLGREASVLLQPDSGDKEVPEIREALAERREVHLELRMLRRDGSPLWSEVYIAPVLDVGGDVSHFVIAHYDISDKKRSEEELVYRANHDMLTGLANRRLLSERMQEMIARAAPRRQEVWLMFIDLDRFKVVNDSLGHRGGDEFLRLMAQRLRACVRDTDVVARLHGDEFLAALPEGDDAAETALVVQRLLDAVAAPLMVGGHELTVSCSAGVAKYPADGDTPNALIDNADIALYKAKELGRNTVKFFEPGMNADVHERLRMERGLRQALERGELMLHYQPQFDLSSGQQVGIEALLRWNSPEFGMVAPSRFIQLAGETGLMIPIGEWVLRTACAQAESWRAKGLGELRIAVNLSARQFRQLDLVRVVDGVLRDTGLPPAQLELELTETLVMEDIDGAVDVMQRLRELGVVLSVDDFGTGYSSLAGLNRFPVDVLKIDSSFVRDIKAYSHETSIPAAIISMAHSLGLRVIAEGVETEAQCEFLSRNMCDEVQGYLFSPPLPAAEMEAFLRAGRSVPEHLRRMYKRQRTLLLVDDEPNILSALRRLIRGAGYRVLTAGSGSEGLEVLAQTEVDVIVSDQRMPGMTGVEFLRSVKELYPDTVRIVLSGFTELQSVTDAVNEGAIYKFLTKPWDDEQLRGHIEEGFAHKEMADENRRLELEVRTANHGLATANRQLEAVLRSQERQMERDEIVLDVVREGLQAVPLPVIGLADDMLVAFANRAAERLFAGAGGLLGADATQVMPGLVLCLRGLPGGQACEVELHGRRFVANARRMGEDAEARGMLITLVPVEAAPLLEGGADGGT